MKGKRSRGTIRMPQGPRINPHEHVHVFVWVSSSNMPGMLLHRCACGDVLGTRRLSK